MWIQRNNVFFFILRMFYRIDTYVGFYTAWLEQVPLVLLYCIYLFVFVLLFIGLCSYVNASVFDFKMLIDDLNAHITVRSHVSEYIADALITKTSDSMLKEAIMLHNDVLKYETINVRSFVILHLKKCTIFYRLLQNIKQIMSGPLFFELLCVIVITVCELLSLDYAITEHQFDSMLILIVCCLLIHMSMLSLLSHHSENLTTKSYDIANITYLDLQWYNLTVSQQKLLVLPIIRAQKTFRLEGFGILDCSLEMFLKVISMNFFRIYKCSFQSRKQKLINSYSFQIIRSSISYFMVMRKLKN